MVRDIELLAPARNLECGIAAIDHGADAVYIGADRFGARAAAGNNIDDIRQLCGYAHKFLAKVYVTFNTIIYDNELEAAGKLLNELSAIGVDAVLVQDMALLQLGIGCHDMQFHASTQTDNRTAEKVRWLRSLGFSRVVLARELSLGEIRAIHESVPDVELEAFVHGALCVSYSGACYASQYCFGRSANRGECAQFCRMKFDLLDSDGKCIEHGRHLLSLKDMSRYDNMEELLEAGVSSLKIEGRLKDIDYVKNVTAAYSERLNGIIARHPERYRRASVGRCVYTFTPNLQKTFNRGFTNYFLNGRQPDIVSFDTPKAKGEYVGKVKEIRGASFTVAGTASFSNGDGLCFINDRHGLEGFRVNKVESNRLYPFRMPAGLRPGTALYRNSDQDFGRKLARSASNRKIPVSMVLLAQEDGFELIVSVCDGISASVSLRQEKQTAVKPQRENIMRQLSKLGNTVYECAGVQTVPDDFNFFIPMGALSDLRRRAIEKLDRSLAEYYKRNRQAGKSGVTSDRSYPLPEEIRGWSANISNRLSRQFYRRCGLSDIEDAFELKPVGSPLIMQCRHCLRYSLGYCVRHGGNKPSWHEPLYLRLADGRRFRLQFNCSDCQMSIYADE